jgi:hypothetical protein
MMILRPSRKVAYCPTAIDNPRVFLWGLRLVVEPGSAIVAGKVYGEGT